MIDPDIDKFHSWCNKIWQTEGKPQLYFLFPGNQTSLYSDRIAIGNYMPDLLIPYRKKGNIFVIGKESFELIEFKSMWPARMVLGDMNGNSITYNETLFADKQLALTPEIQRLYGL